MFVTGCGEHLSHKTPTYSVDEVPRTPISHVADKAFAMSGLARSDIDMVQLYDCYTITVLLTIEQSGFCGAGEGMQFVRDHDLSYKGDFPCNTHGGMLGAGQPGFAGGMSMVVEAARQIQGVSDNRQLRKHDTAYVSGTGGIMSEQAALILQGCVTMNAPKPRPVPTPTSQPFWDALREERISMQRCEACNGWVHYPRTRCSHCLSDRLAWHEVADTGTVYTFSVARQPTTPQFLDETPQVIAVVELDDGPASPRRSSASMPTMCGSVNRCGLCSTTETTASPCCASVLSSGNRHLISGR